MLASGHTRHLEQKIPRNYIGLKLTVYMCRWGKFWTKDTKRPKNPTATFEVPEAKIKSRILRMLPALNTTYC